MRLLALVADARVYLRQFTDPWPGHQDGGARSWNPGLWVSVALLIPAAAMGQLQPRPTHEPVITRLDPRFDRLVPPGAVLEKLVDDHGWTEGPVWVRDGGYLLFSDVVKNRIYRWKEGEGESVYLDRSGYTGSATFAGPELRVYASDDLPGIEWASALVGCLAIAVGFGQEVGLHAGLIATLVSRGVEEAARIAASAGGDERTLLGLAGYGDLLASISQRERPEVLVGAALARGKTVAEAVAEAKERVEAVELLPRIAAWADAHGVNVPIFRALAARMLGGHAAGDIVHELMITPPQRLH